MHDFWCVDGWRLMMHEKVTISSFSFDHPRQAGTRASCFRGDEREARSLPTVRTSCCRGVVTLPPNARRRNVIQSTTAGEHLDLLSTQGAATPAVSRSVFDPQPQARRSRQLPPELGVAYSGTAWRWHLVQLAARASHHDAHSASVEVKPA